MTIESPPKTARTAIVTGASRGIGLAIATRLVNDGARVVITGRNPDTLTGAVARLGGASVALGVAGHAADSEHQADVVARALDAFGSIDLLVNNTGINPTYGPLTSLDLDTARKIVDVNCVAALSWIQRVHGAWMAEHGGSILNVASIAGLHPAPGIGFYAASKAMLIHLTQELAVELGPEIRVNAIAPGVVKTQFATELYEGREEQVSARYPLKRLGLPDDIGDAAAFLLGDDARWLTGQTLVVDGGVLLTGGGM